MSISLLIIFTVITIVVGVLIALDHKKILIIKKKSHKTLLYIVLVFTILLACVPLFGKPLLKMINAYQDGVLMESEEQCKGENAPFWCSF
jgi:membrane-bound ClpP family serine protease